MNLPVLSTHEERIVRAARMLEYLKEEYPEPKSELTYHTPFQFILAVMFSAQCTDKKVNQVTATLFEKYKTIDDFANADLATFTTELSSITYFQNKAKHAIASAKMMRDEFGGEVPRTESELTRLPGVGYKSAHVILNELFDIAEGIPTDTHVRRFALRFDLTSNTELTKISKDLEQLVPKKDWRYVNNGLVLYGRYVCNAIPHPCEDHPLTPIWPPAAYRWPKAK